MNSLRVSLKTLFLSASAALTVSNCQAGSFIATNFAGPSLSNVAPLTGYAFAPSDMSGAAGPNHVVQFINGAFTIYNRSGAVVSPTISDTAFWANAGISANTLAAGVSDTRLIYDSDSQHWFAAQISTDNSSNKVLLAVSNSSDPTAGFKAVEFVANTGTGNFADQPTLGIDKNGVYIGASNFTPAGNYANTSSLFSIPKSDLVGGTPSLSRLTRFEDVSASTVGFEPDPVVNMNGVGGHVLGIDAVTFGKVDQTSINGSSGAGATLSASSRISIAHDSNPGLGRQPDGTQLIDTADDRINSSVYEANGLIYAAHNVGETNGQVTNSRSLVDWMVIDAATGVVKAEGLLSDPNYDFYYGSVAANANGDFVISYNRSGGANTGAAGNISGYADVCHFNGTGASCDTPLLLSQGAANNYHLFGGSGERWGDYSAASNDPNDSNSFWVYTSAVRGANDWGTQISQITLSSTLTDTPEPSTMAMFLAGFAALAAGRKRAGSKAPAGSKANAVKAE